MLFLIQGRVPWRGSFPLAPSVGVVGPLAATAKDLELAYRTIAGVKPAVLINSLQGVKIGIYKQYFQDASKEIVDLCYKFVEKLESFGALVIPIEIPHLEEFRVAHINCITSEMMSGNAIFDWTKFSTPTKLALTVCKHNLTATDYLDALKYKTLGVEIFTELYKRVDLIITPTTAITAPEIPSASTSYGLSDLTNSSKAMRFIFLANLLGLPAVTVPVGFDSKDLPIGCQFMAKW